MSGGPGLWLESESLLSKWGFNDGELPDQLLDWLDTQGLPYPGDWREVLPLLVERELLPALDQAVTLTRIGGNHNPVRAKTVDGVDVEACWYDTQAKVTLTPDGVTVLFPRVLAFIREVEETP